MMPFFASDFGRRRRWALGAFCLLLAGCKIGDVDFADGGLFDDAGAFVDAAADDAGGRHDAGDASFDAGIELDAAPDPDGGVGSEPLPSSWPMLFAGALCDALEACYGSAEVLRDTLDGRDCTALNENALRNGELRYLPDSVAADRVIWFASEIEDCLQDIRELGCEARGARMPASCELAVAGTVPLGSDCTLDEECLGDAYCDRQTALTCPGTCAELLAEDASCTNNDDDQCRDGLVCFSATERCEPLGELGIRCGGGLPGCKPGLVCSGAAGAARCAGLQTVYFRQLGEACERGGDLCEPGLVCESVTDEAGICAEKVGFGDSCKRAIPNQCPATQYCSATSAGETGTCTDYPGDGEPCITDGRTQTCADGSICIETTCRERKQVDEPCLTDVQCWSGACGDDALCAAPPMCELP